MFFLCTECFSVFAPNVPRQALPKEQLTGWFHRVHRNKPSRFFGAYGHAKNIMGCKVCSDHCATKSSPGEGRPPGNISAPISPCSRQWTKAFSSSTISEMAPNPFDYFEIQNTIARYCIAIDTKNFDLLQDVFSDDVQAKYPFNEFQSRQALAQAIEKRLLKVRPTITAIED